MTMTMIESTAKELPSPTLAVLVHRSYADRVRDKLLGVSSDWRTVHVHVVVEEKTQTVDVVAVVAVALSEEFVVAADVHENEVAEKLTGSTSRKRTLSPSIQQQQQEQEEQQEQQAHHQLQPQELQKSLTSSSCRILFTPAVRGVRKNRRGYTLLILQGVKTCLTDLSPIARQNICSAMTLTHKITIPSSTNTTITTTTTTTEHTSRDESSATTKSASSFVSIGTHLWKLLQEQNFMSNTSTRNHEHCLLRVECIPKQDTERMCTELQQAAAAAVNSALALHGTDNKNDDTKVHQQHQQHLPFDGPIPMTKSASKCTHVLNIIRDDNNGPGNNDNTSKQHDDDNCCYYWVGIMSNTEFNAYQLNDKAAAQVIICPTDPKSGHDLKPNVPCHAPVSRAYYKLQQLWDEEISTLFSTAKRTTASSSITNNNENHNYDNDTIMNDTMQQQLKILGTAIDLGSAPGGWTQTLMQHFVHVIAVDPGIMAQRVLGAAAPAVATANSIQHGTTTTIRTSIKKNDTNKVHHVVADLSSEAVATALQEAKMPLSIMVCDASTDSNVVLGKILDLLQRLAQNNNSNNKNATAGLRIDHVNSSSGYCVWTLPCVWVVTLKLPHKTSASLERNLALVLDTIPQHLQKAFNLMSFLDDTKSDDDDNNKTTNDSDSVSLVPREDVSIRFQILHLIANSESERTLHVVFERKQTGQ